MMKWRIPTASLLSPPGSPRQRISGPRRTRSQDKRPQGLLIPYTGWSWGPPSSAQPPSIGGPPPPPPVAWRQREPTVLKVCHWKKICSKPDSLIVWPKPLPLGKGGRGGGWEGRSFKFILRHFCSGCPARIRTANKTEWSQLNFSWWMAKAEIKSKTVGRLSCAPCILNVEKEDAELQGAWQHSTDQPETGHKEPWAGAI